MASSLPSHELKDYADAQAESRDIKRRTVLDAAGRILTEKGAEALTMRNLAGRIGTSTKVLYTLFKSKEGLANALFIEGFRLLDTYLDAVPDTLAPVPKVIELGHAYFRNALTNAHYYGVMYLQVIPGFQPSPEAFSHGVHSFGTLVRAVQACIDAGDFPRESPRHLALSLTSAAHGVASLYLSGRLRNPETGQPDLELARSLFEATFGDLVAGIQGRSAAFARSEQEESRIE